jgi:hypothetical protein
MADNQYMQPFFDSLSQGVQVAQHITSAAQQQRQFDQQQQLAQSQLALSQQEQGFREHQGLSQLLQSGAGELVPDDGMRPQSPISNDPKDAATAMQLTQTPSSGGGSSAAPPAAPATGGTDYANPSPFSYQPQADTVPNSPALPGAPTAGASSMPSMPGASAPAGTGLMSQLNAASGVAAPTPAYGVTPSQQPQGTPYDPNRIVSLAGRKVYIKTPEEMNAQNAAAKAAESDVDKIQLPNTVADTLGYPRGTKMKPVDIDKAAALVKQFKPEDSGKTIQRSWESKDDSGNQTLVTQYTDGTVNEMPLKAKGTSNKFDPANAAASATEGQTKALTENQRQESANKALKDYQTLNEQKTKLEAENSNIAIALKTGKHYLDKDGHLTAFDKGAGAIPEDAQAGYQDAMKARLAANQSRLPQVVSDMQGAQNRYADLSKNEGARPTSGTPAAPAAAAATPAAPVAKAATPAPAAKAATPAAQYKENQVLTNAKGEKVALIRGKDGKLAWQPTK